MSVNQFAIVAQASSVNSISTTEEEFQTFQQAAEAEFGETGALTRKQAKSAVGADEVTELLQSLID